MGVVIGLIVSIICAVICANLAKKKGKSVPLFAVLGFFLSIIGVIIAVVVKPSNQA
jgi:hypothetical protein